METTIRIKPAEFNESLFDLLRELVKEHDIKDITINLNDAKPKVSLRKETKERVRKRIEKAANDYHKGKSASVSFTAAEFEKLSMSLLKK